MDKKIAMLQISFIKKKLENGEWCSKCNDVNERLYKDDLLKYIDQTIVADVNNPESEGIKLALEYNVDRAPFFIVRDTTTNSVEVFDVYFKFKRHIQRLSVAAA